MPSLRNEPIDTWLAHEVRISCIRENAATLAVLEIPERREEIARSYRDRHPTHQPELDELLAILEQAAPKSGSLHARSLAAP